MVNKKYSQIGFFDEVEYGSLWQSNNQLSKKKIFAEMNLYLDSDSYC